MQHSVLFKRLSLAAGIMLTAASSQADQTVQELAKNVDLYGVLDFGMTWVSDEGGESKTTMRDSVNWGNRLGFKGSLDLVPGYHVIFKLEHGFNLSDGETSQYGTTWGRQAWAGVESDNYGKLTFGRQYDFMYDNLNMLNIGGYATTYAGHHGDFDRISGWRVDKSIKYVSPSMGGLTLGVMYAADDATYAYQDAGTKETLSAGANYYGGNWSLAAAYVKIENNDIYPDLQVGVDHFLGQDLNFDFSAMILDQETMGVAGYYSLGKLSLVGNTTQTTFKQGSAKETQHVYEVGGFYPLTDTLLAIAGYQYSTLAGQDWKQYTLGLKQDITDYAWLYASVSKLTASDGVKVNQGAAWYMENSSDNKQDTARIGMILTF